jgi:hypothetical protein
MEALSENIRKITTFLLAVFLWLHALFILNVQSTFAAKSAQYLRLTISETLLLALNVLPVSSENSDPFHSGNSEPSGDSRKG